MNKNLIYFLVFILAAIVISSIAYNKYLMRTEEGLVYLDIFKPKEEIIEFENVITLSRPGVCRSSKAHFNDLPTEAVNEFIKANKKGVSPIRLTALEGKVPIVSWDDTKSMHERGTIFAFHPENKRLLYLSRVGFNKQRTNAIACIEISDNNYGQGILFFLEKKEDSWKVSKDLTIWVS